MFCFGNPLYPFLALVAVFLLGLALLQRHFTRKAKAACVGRYSEFWFTFALVYRGPFAPGPFDRGSFLTSVHPHDVDTLLRYRRRLFAANAVAVASFGLAFAILVRLC